MTILLRWLATLLLLGAITLALLAAAEFALRKLDYPQAPPQGWKWEQSPYRNQSDTATHQLGLRGAPISIADGDFVITLVGDSQVEAGTQPVAEMPERLLQDLLRDSYGLRQVKVFSVASAGWGTDQQYLALQQYLGRFRSDLVVLWFTSVNDYWENGFIDRSVSAQAGPLKPTFALDTLGQLQPVRPHSRAKLALLADQALARLRGVSQADILLQRWLARLPSPAAVAPAATATAGVTGTPSCPAERVDQARMFAYRGAGDITVDSTEEVGARRSHFSPFGRDLSERERQQIHLTHQLLSAIEQQATARRAAFRIFYPYRSDLDGVLAKVKCVRTPDGQLHAIDGSDLLRHLAATPLRERLITPSLRHESDIAISPTDIHHNLKGNRLAMSALAETLYRQGLLPAAAPASVAAPRVASPTAPPATPAR